MILNEFYLVDYLVEMGFLTYENLILDNTILIKNHSRRSNCYSFENSEQSFFFKQQFVLDDDKNYTFKNEVELYCSLLERIDLAPKKIFFDEANNILCLEYLKNAKNLSFKITSHNLLGDNFAEILAQKLIGLHTTNSITQSRRKPWILDIYSKEKFRYISKNETAKEIIRFVHSNETLCARIKKLEDDFIFDSFSHNDLKTENVLVCDEIENNKMFIIDWEFATLGDCTYDLGTLLSSYLFYWVKKNEDGDVNYFYFFKKLFQFYRSHNNLEEKRFLSKITKFAGVRLLQFCLESSNSGKTTFDSYKKTLQLSFNLLEHNNKLYNFFIANEELQTSV